MKLTEGDVRLFEVETGELVVIRLDVPAKVYDRLDVILPKIGTVIFNAFGAPIGHQFGYSTVDSSTSRVRTPVIKLYFPRGYFKTGLKDAMPKFQKVADYVQGEVMA